MEEQEVHPTIRITVTNPEKHGDGVKGYISFCITTLTDLPNIQALPASVRDGSDGFGKMEVRRRYSDFVWLRNQLVASNPMIIVPPLPQKLTEKFLDRFSGEFLEKRRKGLELFLNRVALHPSLITSMDLNTFLCAKEWELKTVQNESEGTTVPSSSNAMTKKITKLSKPSNVEVDPEQEKFEKIRKYFESLQTHLNSTQQQIELIHKKNQEFIGEYTSIAPSFLWLAESETELSSPLSGIGRAYTENLIPSLQELTQQQEYGLIQALQQYSLTCDAALEVFDRRETILNEYLTAQKNLEGVRAELLKTQHEQMNPGTKSAFSIFKSFEEPQVKIQRLELKLDQDEKNLQQKKTELDKVSDVVLSELERFHKWKIHDFQLMLKDLVQSQMEYHRKVNKAWQNVVGGIEELSLNEVRRTFWMSQSRQSIS